MFGDFDVFTRNLKEYGYEAFERGERHGSSEWTWHKPKEKLHKFVVLAATPEALTAQYSVEVWAGADDGERFARSLRASFDRVELRTLKDLTEMPLLGMLTDALKKAATFANQMSAGDLVNRRDIPVKSAK